MAHIRNAGWQANGLVTLTTDFGLRDPFVGVMKGVLLARFPRAQLIDLTHGILAHWPAEAGFWLARSAAYFSSGTLHVAVVDPGVGSSRRILMAEANDQLFLAPDNGLLGSVLERLEIGGVWELEPGRQPGIFPTRISATFHGRDLFAPAAAALASGELRPEQLGKSCDSWVPSWIDEVRLEGNTIKGVVVTIDHFGNLLTNIDGNLVRRMADPHVYLAGRTLPLKRTYSDVQPGDDLALLNSFDVLEIARAQGNAAEALGLERGAPVVVQDGVRHR